MEQTGAGFAPTAHAAAAGGDEFEITQQHSETENDSIFNSNESTLYCR